MSRMKLLVALLKGLSIEHTVFVTEDPEIEDNEITIVNTPYHIQVGSMDPYLSLNGYDGEVMTQYAGPTKDTSIIINKLRELLGLKV